MNNRAIFHTDPLAFELLNNGVSKVAEIAADTQALRTLRFELETFVCDGEYARGLDRILTAYLDDLTRSEQRAAWVSGFYGSGKSHLVKMLRYLWADFRFPDGASARSLARLPRNVADLFVELDNRSRPFGGCAAASGTLGKGDALDTRLAFVQLVLRGAGLPEALPQARFALWLKADGRLDEVQRAVTARGANFAEELANLHVSTDLPEALAEVNPKLGSPAEVQARILAQFPRAETLTIGDALTLVRQVFTHDGQLPCTLLVIDEIQQFIGDNKARGHDVQELVESVCTDLQSRILVVGTGQSALTAAENLRRLQARFTVRVQLSDAEVESVIRKTVLLKREEHKAAIAAKLEETRGEISRHLQGTRLATRPTDDEWLVADYPLLPTRRRFWEKVLRNTDQSGTTAQLRTQLKIVFDAARETAERSLGTVVAADFIFDQLAPELLNTGALQREYYEIIMRQRDGTPEGLLCSRLCALIYLVAQLNEGVRGTPSDDGVRATPEFLADLLVEDLSADGARLRREIPPLLEQLVLRGDLMKVESEYRLQTRESASWTHDFSSRKARLLTDETRLTTQRNDRIEKAVEDKLRLLQLQQGAAREARKLDPHWSHARPTQSAEQFTLWLRHGWDEDESVVRADAQAAGTDSPMLFAWLPRERHEDLREALAAAAAARETLDHRGPPATPQDTEARKAIETHCEVAELKIRQCLDYLVGKAKVFLGGGEEANGIELPDKIADAARAALHRLFPNFAEADDARWPQVSTRARAGDVGALGVLGYQGDPERHPVCQHIRNFIGAGRRGREVREHFRTAPFGWPQDAIDGALYILTAAGNVRASLNGQPVAVTALPQNQLGTASFAVDVPPLNASQRIALRGLFGKLEVIAKNGEESAAAATFLQKLITLGESAGGEPPLPEPPKGDLRTVRELAASSGNAQLLAIHEQTAALEGFIESWKKIATAITKRLPSWQRLREFHNHAAPLPEAGEAAGSIAAIEAQRTLLAEPDPVPALTARLTAALRSALGALQSNLAAAFTTGAAQLAASGLWPRLKDAQRRELTARHQLDAPTPAPIGTDDELLAALRAAPLAARRDLVDAIPARFARALEDATRLLEPKAQRVPLPPATLKTEAELDAWLTQVRGLVAGKLKDGPVIL